MTTKTYSIFKWITMWLLPSLMTFYFAIAQTWGLEYTTEIIGTILAVNIWLSAILAVENAQFKNNVISGGSERILITIPGLPFEVGTIYYEYMKWITIAFLPATGGLYLTLAQLWHLKYGVEVAATFSAIAAFFGTILKISKKEILK